MKISTEMKYLLAHSAPRFLKYGSVENNNLFIEPGSLKIFGMLKYFFTLCKLKKYNISNRTFGLKK